MNLLICQTLQVRIYVRQMSDFRFPRNWSLDNNYNAGTNVHQQAGTWVMSMVGVRSSLEVLADTLRLKEVDNTCQSLGISWPPSCWSTTWPSDFMESLTRCLPTDLRLLDKPKCILSSTHVKFPRSTPIIVLEQNF